MNRRWVEGRSIHMCCYLTGCTCWGLAQSRIHSCFLQTKLHEIRWITWQDDYWLSGCDLNYKTGGCVRNGLGWSRRALWSSLTRSSCNIHLHCRSLPWSKGFAACSAASATRRRRSAAAVATINDASRWSWWEMCGLVRWCAHPLSFPLQHPRLSTKIRIELPRYRTHDGKEVHFLYIN